MNYRSNVRELRSERILPVHLERLAVVYIRQSTLQQVRLASRINATSIRVSGTCPSFGVEFKSGFGD